MFIGSTLQIDLAGNSSTVTLHATVSSSLYPGASSPVSFTVDNPVPTITRVPA